MALRSCLRPLTPHSHTRTHTGGYVELSVLLPGALGYSGLQPSVSLVGNLARLGYNRSMASAAAATAVKTG